MKRCFGWFAFVLFFCGDHSHAQDKKTGDRSETTGSLKKGEVLDTVQGVQNISPDGKVTTWILRNLQAGVGGVKGGVPFQSRTATISIPIQANGKGTIKVRFIIRGNVDIQGKGDGSLLLHAGGKSVSIDVHKKGNFVHTVDNVIVPDGDNFRATFFLFAERHTNNAEDGFVLTVDAFDVVVIDGTTGKK
jgi:hypothetical protein